MKKKIYVVSFILIFSIIFSACGSKNKTNENSNVKKGQKEDTFDSSTFNINDVSNSQKLSNDPKVQEVLKKLDKFEEDIDNKSEELKKASYDKISVRNEAIKSRMNKEMEIELKKIQNEKATREKYKLKFQEQVKDYENKKTALDKIWDEYNEKIKKAKEGRENVKKAIESQLAKQTKENTNTNLAEVEKYKSSIQDIIKWRNSELAKVK